MEDVETLLIGLGVGLVLLSLLIEIEHKTIWNNYRKNYTRHQNPTLEALLRPNIWVYRLNIYVVWPLILILGVITIVRTA